MYGLPADFDYSIFAGITVVQIAFMEYSVRIEFDSDLSILMESSYSHQLHAGDEERVVLIPPNNSTLMQLVGKEVVSAGAQDSHTLVLRFKGHHILKCFDDNKMYECFKIIDGQKETIV